MNASISRGNPHRWQQLTLAQQLGQVGSELSRAQHWEKKNDGPSRDRALERALHLMDQMIQDRRWQRRRKELTRLREVIADWFCGHRQYEIPPHILEKYFIPFGLQTRKLLESVQQVS